MIRVLQVYRCYFPETTGGLEEVIRQLSKGLLESSDFEVKILTLSQAIDDVTIYGESGVEVVAVPVSLFLKKIRFPSASLSSIRKISELYDWANVLHYHFPWPGCDMLDFAFGGSEKVRLVTYHCDIVRPNLLRLLYKPFGDIFLSKMDAVVATSPNYRDSSPVLKTLGDLVKVIPLGIGSPPPLNKAVVETIRNSYGSDFFLFVGVHRYYKNLKTLIAAIAGTELHVVICGEGPTTGELKSLAKLYKVEDQVRFPGFVSEDEKYAFMSLAKAFVLPSSLRTEAFGVCLLEAQAMKLPLITCDIGAGMSYVNVHGQTGFIVAPNDPEDLRNAMKEIVSNVDDTLMMGIASRARYEEKFGVRLMIDSYASLIRELSNAKGKR